MRRPGDRDEAETEASDNPQDTGSHSRSPASSASSASPAPSASSVPTRAPLAPPPALPAPAGAAKPAGPGPGPGAGPGSAARKPPLDRGGLVNLLARVREHLAREHEGPHRLTVVQHRLVLDRLAGAGMIAPIATCPRAKQLEAVVETVCEVVGVEAGVVEGCL